MGLWKNEYNKVLKALCEKRIKYKEMVPYFPDLTAAHIARKANLLGYSNNFIKVGKYGYDKGVFEKLNYEYVYWFGWLFADGTFYQNSEYSVFLCWECHISDEEFLQKFLNFMKCPAPIKRYYIQNDKYILKDGDWHSKISIGISQAYPKIKEYFGNLVLKTYRGVPPNLPNIELKLAFICGYLNGDGWICVHKKKKSLTLGFASASVSILQWIMDIFESFGLPSGHSKTQDYNSSRTLSGCKDSKAKYLRYNGVRALYLYEILKLAPVPILDRKWNNPEVLECVSFNKEKYKDRNFESIESIMLRNNIDFSKTFPSPENNLIIPQNLV